MTQSTISQQHIKKIKNKITNKKFKAVMSTDVDKHLVNRRVELIGERYD